MILRHPLLQRHVREHPQLLHVRSAHPRYPSTIDCVYDKISAGEFLNSLLTAYSSPSGNESYAYDADGNRTYQVVNGTATSFSYPSTSNRLASMSGDLNASWGYGADGNLTTINGLTAYQYGPFDRLINAAGEGYAISAEGQRVEKTGGAGTTYFATGTGGTLMAEYQGSTGMWYDYVWLNGKLVTVITDGGNPFPIRDDQTGRPFVITNPYSKTVIWQAWNAPFGHRDILTDNYLGGFNLGFPGQYYDSESGLDHNGNRDYNPLIGRYIEPDPQGLMGGLDLYVYADNNPISNVDPLGLCDQQKCADASAVVAALGQTLSSAGSEVAWTGVGMVGLSMVGAIFAPEGAELEVDGGIDGGSMIVAGSRLSMLGGMLTGYARDGVTGALENGAVMFALGKLNEGIAGLSLPEGTGEATTKAVTGVLDEAGDAIQAEAAACVGH